jgi:excisionase family DNA binding protein
MANQHPPERYLWPHEVAELLNVHTKTINQWSRQGRLPHIRTLGRHRRYPESEILALRQRLTSEVTS